MLADTTRMLTTGLPWLVCLLISATLTYAVTSVAPVSPLPTEWVTYSESCAPTADRMLAYAVSTHRVPASVSLDCREPHLGPYPPGEVG